MLINEFIEATNRLEKYFEKEYSKEQMQIMFDELQNLSLEKYRKTINNCLKTCKYLPKLADLVANLHDIDNVSYNEKKEYEECKICKGAGFIKYYKIINDGDKEFQYDCFNRCICKNADNYSKKIPTFEEVGVKPYEKIFVNWE